MIDLEAIRKRAEAALAFSGLCGTLAGQVIRSDVPALCDEVETLREVARLVIGAEIAWCRDEHPEAARGLLIKAGQLARSVLSATEGSSVVPAQAAPEPALPRQTANEPATPSEAGE